MVRLKLKSNKCNFRVSIDKFLGYMVANGQLSVNPDKVQAILEMICPKTIREVQKLMRCLAALGRFLSKSIERQLSFFQAPKQIKDFVWDE